MPVPVIADLLESPVMVIVLLFVALLILGRELPSLSRDLERSANELRKDLGKFPSTPGQVFANLFLNPITLFILFVLAFVTLSIISKLARN